MNELTIKVAALVQAGRRPAEIAAELNIDSKTVYNRLVTIRRNGIEVPRFRLNGFPQPKRRVPLTVEARELLEPAARRRGMDVMDLAARILEIIARDGLVDAVMADGVSDDDR